MRYLVTGGHGTVAGYLRRLAPSFDAELVFVGRQDFDIADLSQTRDWFADKHFDGIINLAAATDVDRCEQEPEWAFRANAVGPSNLALMAQAQNAWLMQVSTTEVFGAGGALGPFSEMDRPDPINVYAESKWAGERAVQALVPRHFVVRTCWVMGGGRRDKKFVGKVVGKLRDGAPVQAVDDQYGSPTYAQDLAVVLRELVFSQAFGLYHAVNRGTAHRLAMVEAMKSILGSTSTVTGVPAQTFPLPAPRPRSEAAHCWALAARGMGEHLPDWEDALRRYLEEIAAEQA